MHIIYKGTVKKRTSAEPDLLCFQLTVRLSISCYYKIAGYSININTLDYIKT